VIKSVMKVVETCQKPVVVNFSDGDPGAVAAGGGIIAYTLEDAAVKAVAASTSEAEGAIRERLLSEAKGTALLAQKARDGLSETQQYVRGLFSGGTFTNEAAMLLRDWIGSVHTNGKIKRTFPLSDPRKSVGHTCVDLGEDVFTVGRPHPMLEPAVRRERLLVEAADPETAVILLDVVIGYGAHPDPAGELMRYVVEARELAQTQGRQLPVVGSVCGVDGDPQSRASQVHVLQETGVLVMPTNVQATALAVQIATGVTAGSANRKEQANGHRRIA